MSEELLTELMDLEADERARLETFCNTLHGAPARALLLDYDGTLAPFVTNRLEAVPYPGVREVLGAIAGSGRTRLVVISGRWTQELVPLLGLKPIPELWGAHGWEHRLPGHDVQVLPMPLYALEGLEEAWRWALDEALEERLERKPGCLALHWRGLDEAKAQALREKALPLWEAVARKKNLLLTEFDGGLELRAPGRDKGDACRAVLDELPEGAAVAYLGDDLTDEDAFAALGTRGLGVLVRPQRRPSAAAVWLRPPGQLLAFLQRWLGETTHP